MLRSARALVLGLLVAFAPPISRRAEAGLLSQSVDFIQLTPFVGGEVAHFGFAGVDPTGMPKTGSFDVPFAFTFGGTLGFRLGPFNFDVLFQRTLASDDTGADVRMHKLYGEFGINLGSGLLRGLIHVDFGYAFLNTQDTTVQGFGGKLGAVLDLYPLRWLSLGAGADFDVQGYSLDSGMVGAYGFTLVGRVGIHI